MSDDLRRRASDRPWWAQLLDKRWGFAVVVAGALAWEGHGWLKWEREQLGKLVADNTAAVQAVTAAVNALAAAERDHAGAVERASWPPVRLRPMPVPAPRVARTPAPAEEGSP